MTTHPTPAEKLLAMLEEDQAFETLPGGEVCEDLAAVGIDPSRAIAFARALASGAGTPGGQLLGAIDLAEDEDDEIARLERADIEDVRAQIPQGTAAAAAAAARRQAGGETTVVAMKPRRRSMLVWGGPAAGIAALVTLFGFVWLLDFQEKEMMPEPQLVTDSIESAPQPEPEAALGKPVPLAELKPLEPKQEEKALAPSMPPAMDFGAGEALAPPGPLAELESFESKQQEESFMRSTPPAMEPEADARRSRQMAPAAPMGGAAPQQSLAKKDTADELADLRQESSPADAPAASAEGFALEREIAGTATTAQDQAGPDEGVLARNTEPLVLRAMLIVDPMQIPLSVQSEGQQDSGLRGRVAEAQALAGERPVIALYRLQSGAAQMDFAQVPLEIGLTQQMAPPSPLTDLIGEDARNYDFIPLPAE